MRSLYIARSSPVKIRRRREFSMCQAITKVMTRLMLRTGEEALV